MEARIRAHHLGGAGAVPQVRGRVRRAPDCPSRRAGGPGSYRGPGIGRPCPWARKRSTGTLC